MMQLDLAACVEAGSIRRLIQDDARVDPHMGIAVVAAGKGEPEPAGLASFLAVQGLVKAFAWHGGVGTTTETESRLVAALQHAHELVVEVLANAPRWSSAKTLHEMLRGEGDLLGGPVVRQVIADYRERVLARAPASAGAIGPLATTTLVALVVGDGFVTVSRVGDCRAFHIRRETVESLSGTDANPTMTLGAAVQDVPIATRSIATHPGDAFVLCSYGVWGTLTSTELQRAAAPTSATEACTTLARATMNLGGLDNIALAVVKV